MQNTKLISQPTRIWYLIDCKSPTDTRQQIHFTNARTIVGRSQRANATIANSSVSGMHAEFLVFGDELVVRDLKSTNGTYVNGRQIEGAEPLTQGDLVQLANCLFRVGSDHHDLAANTMESVSDSWAHCLIQFDRLIGDEAINPHYQSIVTLADKTIVGYELLARSELPGIESPGPMFAAAAHLGQEANLSMIARKVGAAAVRGRHDRGELFVNTHPVEVVTDELLDSLRALRVVSPDQKLTIEIHESAITNADEMHRLKKTLDELDMKIAFDDFGAGNARLNELADHAPDYVKFDMKLIRGIDQAASARQSLLGSLVRMVNELGIVSLAEGIETQGEHDACRELGFRLAQGYFYDRPTPLK